MNVSVVVPVYNEETTIAEVLDSLAPLDLYEVIVVDDGSSDGTAALVEEHVSKPILLRQPANRGKGAAIRRGLQAARGDVLVIQDADLELSPTMIKKLVEPIAAGNADAVYGSRFLEGAERVPRVRRAANRFLTRLTNVLYGTELTDMETAHKAFRAPLLAGLDLRSNRFEIEAELTIKLARSGAVFAEIASPYHPRLRSEGKKIRWHDALTAAATLLRYYRWRSSGSPSDGHSSAS